MPGVFLDKFHKTGMPFQQQFKAAPLCAREAILLRNSVVKSHKLFFPSENSSHLIDIAALFS